MSRREHPWLRPAVVPGWGSSTSHAEPAAPSSRTVRLLLVSLQIPAGGRREELRPKASSVAPPRACACVGVGWSWGLAQVRRRGRMEGCMQETVKPP